MSLSISVINYYTKNSLNRMQKSISQCGSGLGTGTRSIAISSRQKFQNVDKLTGIVTQIQQSTSRNVHPEQVLDLIKHKIKTNYNTLYDNYDANKNQILRTIQQAENTNITDTTMKNKLEHVIKEKSHYDKMKAQVEFKQKKLKKLLDLRQQLKNSNGNNEEMVNVLTDRIYAISQLEKYREILDYEAAVLKNMERERTQIKKSLKERHESMRKQENTKKVRAEKLESCNHTKKVILQGISQKIMKQDICQLPESLMEELQKKLEFYQGKYAQENILEHETKINDAKIEAEKTLVQQQNQRTKKLRITKEQQQNKEFDIAYNHLLFRQAEQQKIKILCGVSEITQLATDNLQSEKQNLQHISKQLEAQINRIRFTTKTVESQTQNMITDIQKMHEKTNLLQLQKELEAEQTQLRRLKIHMQKKQEHMNEWESLLQLTLGTLNKDDSTTDCNLNKYTCLKKLKEAIPTLEQLVVKQKLYYNQVEPNQAEIRPRFSKITMKDDDSQSEDPDSNF